MRERDFAVYGLEFRVWSSLLGILVANIHDLCAPRCSVLQCVAVSCSVLQCIYANIHDLCAPRCSVLQCVAVYIREYS